MGKRKKHIKWLRKQIRKNENRGIWSVANAGSVLLESLVGTPRHPDGGS